MALCFSESKEDSNLCSKVEGGRPVMLLFLGMEVWQSADGISLGEGKYAVEILKRFGMMDCKAMATPMASNLKLLSDASSETLTFATVLKMKSYRG